MTTEIEMKPGAPADRSRERPLSLDEPWHGVGRIRIRTLVVIHWFALLGQFGTLIVVHFGFDLTLPLAPALLVVAMAAMMNLVVLVRYAPSARLDDVSAALYLGIDVALLSVLLYLTGGLENPFAVFLLAPVIVSASILSRASTAALCAVVILSATILALWHEPLPIGPEYKAPDLFVFGQWAGLVVSTGFMATYVWKVAAEARTVQEALMASRMALAREQSLASMGALSAAVAHEMGTPLGTIRVAAREIARGRGPDDPYAEEIDQILLASDRCSNILAQLGRDPTDGGADPFDRMPLSTLVEAASAPHQEGPVAITLERRAETDAPEPQVGRSPEIRHAVSTLVENASQFARHHVRVTTHWDETIASVTVEDDGPGFSPEILERLGEPYTSSRKVRGGHMGLGIFIAQTLVSRTGGVMRFGNRPTERGARAVMSWRIGDLTRVTLDDQP